MKTKQPKVHDRIRDLREGKKYTQEFMAATMGISQNAYSRIELGQAKPQLERIVKIAEILETSLTDLIDLDEKQVFNIETNHTLNGKVTNQYVSKNEKEMYEKLETEKDLRIQELKDENTHLKAVIEKLLSK